MNQERAKDRSTLHAAGSMWARQPRLESSSPGSKGVLTGLASIRCFDQVGVDHLVKSKHLAGVCRLSDGERVGSLITDHVGASVLRDLTLICPVKALQHHGLELCQCVTVLAKDEGAIDVCTQRNGIRQSCSDVTNPNTLLKAKLLEQSPGFSVGSAQEGPPSCPS